MNKFTVGLMVVLLFIVAGCTTLPPKNQNNLCEIFYEHDHWYKHAVKSEKKWGVPIPVSMAFIYQESRFVADAKPPRTKFLWIFPRPRKSSAYGYPQAKDETWEWYQKDADNGWGDRDDFSDAMDFIAWYNVQSHRKLGLSKTDAYSLYLAYHEGHGGFSRGTYKNKQWLLNVASKVQRRSQQYGAQLASCRKDLDSDGWWPF
ncbi:transglycosylase SLT domain-containing protein [Aurantivibrio plasticivorans]